MNRPPPAGPERRPDLVPTAEELAVLRLLAGGRTDASVMRELGISRRTFERRLQSAMNKLGSSSRFQAGYLVCGEGWLEERPR